MPELTSGICHFAPSFVITLLFVCICLPVVFVCMSVVGAVICSYLSVLVADVIAIPRRVPTVCGVCFCADTTGLPW